MLKKMIKEGNFTVDEINELVKLLYEKSPLKHNPVANIQFVDIDKVQPNDYNPNAVAKQEMKLLYTSIKCDGYTQPVVTIYDETQDKYIIVDGFHRYYVMKHFPDVFKENDGKLPIVVINKNINERMASTIRHNRARGKHSLTGMGNIVMTMFQNGITDEQICNDLGLEPDELIRLKYTTGIAKLFKDTKFSNAGKPDYQIKKEYDPTVKGSEPIYNKNYKNVKVDN